MDHDLHQAVSQANYVVGSLIDASFYQQHRMDPLAPLATARMWMAKVSEHLDAYEATIREANRPVAA